jgi:hypothetical protein
MTAIAGASAGVKDMADGTLRITIEFDPKDAKSAYELFGARGTPVAVAALKVGYAAVQEPERAKVGPLCREAIGLCQMPEFQGWLDSREWLLAGEDGAKAFILAACQIESRKELDASAYAGNLFVNDVRLPFMRWMKARAK